MSTPPPKKSTLVPDPAFSKPATHAQIERAASKLKEHGIHAIVVPARGDALQILHSLIPEHSEVLVSTSETMAQIGFSKEVEESKTQDRELRQLSQSPPYDVGSVHAVTEEGDIVIASATGSQLGPYAFGAGKVIWVAGAQKVVPTLADGLRRVREYALPLEDARALQAYGVNSSLSKMLIISREHVPGRATIVLVEEVLGF